MPGRRCVWGADCAGILPLHDEYVETQKEAADFVIENNEEKEEYWDQAETTEAQEEKTC
jgi:hypothetical protein